MDPGNRGDRAITQKGRLQFQVSGCGEFAGKRIREGKFGDGGGPASGRSESFRQKRHWPVGSGGGGTSGGQKSSRHADKGRRREERCRRENTRTVNGGSHGKPGVGKEAACVRRGCRQRD